MRKVKVGTDQSGGSGVIFRRRLPPLPHCQSAGLLCHQKNKKTVEAVIALRGKDEEEPARLLRLSANKKGGVVTQNSHSCVDGSHKRKSTSTPQGLNET